jgi:hypothetical protein
MLDEALIVSLECREIVTVVSLFSNSLQKYFFEVSIPSLNSEQKRYVAQAIAHRLVRDLALVSKWHY